MASASPLPPVVRIEDSVVLVSSAIFLPVQAMWVLLSSPQQTTPPAYLVPAGFLHLAFAPMSLALPVAALTFFRLTPNCPSPASSLSLATTLFAGFKHAPADQTYKLALKFPSAPHLFQFLQTAINYGARSSPLLTHDLSLFLLSSHAGRNLQANLGGNPVNQTLERVPEPLPSSECAAHSTPSAVQETADNCHVTPLATLKSPSSIAVQQNVTSEPEVYAPDSGDLDVERNEPAPKKRRVRVSTLFPTTECPSIPAASSISWDSGGGCSGSLNDDTLRRQMCYQGHVASEVEERQQSIPRCIEDELENADGLDPSPMRASNRPQEQLLLQPGCELDTRAIDVPNTHAWEDLLSVDLRSELLDCLLNPSFHHLVERVEDLLIEIDNPANIDLATVAEFLHSRQ